MRQITKNVRNQGSDDKKMDFKSPTQMGSLSVKNVSKNSHAWAPLKEAALQTIFHLCVPKKD